MLNRQIYFVNIGININFAITTLFFTIKPFTMNKEFNFYRIKMTYKGEASDGAIVPIKTEDLVMATCYTEAEQIAIRLMEGKDRFGDVSYEIVKTKIDKVYFNDTFHIDENLVCGLITYYFEEDLDTEVGLYAVDAIVYVVDEKTGKTKANKVVIYVPARYSSEAIKDAKAIIGNDYTGCDYCVRNVKYDKAQSVMVTPETHKSNTTTQWA